MYVTAPRAFTICCGTIRAGTRQRPLLPRWDRHASTRPSSGDVSSGWPNPISSSSILVHSKSTFESFASRLPERKAACGEPDATEDVARLLTHLKSTVSRTRRATHAMWAWRSVSYSAPNGVRLCADDGGEAGAGERLERLLEASSCDNVVLIVFRWYGGVHLGSHRWKYISQAAKEALDAGGFRSGPSTKDGTKR
ncbi:ribosomal protein S5 domain 2-like protein [Daedalea quercina L-15889]|uniref:Ribosomal protein S5 domain 2-like protein n=1 Tax=Daedalea quercina L-15889 TaxID=1314783 RepID=A0A165LT22_9APHY|nr:ribosomal protein S5 domain 2-like protein [Daedalea quercina L-15889]